MKNRMSLTLLVMGLMITPVLGWHCTPKFVGTSEYTSDSGTPPDNSDIVARCVHNEDCEAWEKCVKEQCVHPCTEDLDCFGGRVCSSEGQCVAPTTDGGDPDGDNPDGPPGECLSGASRPCYSGPKDTRGKGTCKDGTQTCINGSWAACKDDQTPQTERCDRLDNNCDGTVDEGCKTCEKKELQQLPPGHTSNISAAAFAPRSDSFATTSQDRTLKLWSLPDGKLLKDLDLTQYQQINRLAYLADGKSLISMHADGTFRKWEISSGKLLASVHVESIDPRSFAITPDGASIAVATYQNDVILINTASLTIAKTHKHEIRVRYIAIAPNGKELALAPSRGQIILWDLDADKQRLVIGEENTSVRSLAYTKDGKTLVTFDYSRAYKWDVNSGKEQGHFTLVSSASFAFLSPDGLHAYAIQYNGNIYKFLLSSGARLSSWASGRAGSYALSPDGKSLLIGGNTGDVQVKQTDDGKDILKITKVAYLLSNAVAYHPKGTHFATVEARTKIKIWDRSTKQVLHTLSGTDNIEQIVFSPDGATLYVGMYHATETIIRAWDWAHEKELYTTKKELGNILALTVSPDGTKLYSASEKNTIDEWNATDGSHIRSMRGHTGPVYSMAATADGKHLLTGSWDNNIKLWDLASGDPIKGFQGHDTQVTSVALSPDGKLFASGDDRGLVILWDINSGAQKHQLIGHTDEVNALQFHSSGQTLVSSSSDGTVRLWSVTSGKPDITIPGGNAVYGMSISPDGKELLVGSGQGVSLWECPL